jgi:transcriptional regulator GlxA family with amidase domain
MNEVHDTGLASASMQRLLQRVRAQGQPPLKVGILVSPGYLPMDIIGVHAMFGCAGAELHLLWKTLDVVEGFPLFPTRPTTTLGACPGDLDVLAVGMVPPEVAGDADVLRFFAEQGRRARYVIGTCSGVLVLGASGLLAGRRATSNANVLDIVEALGASPVPGTQVVVDGNVYTAGPATGSFDAALRVLAEPRGVEAARMIELVIEYDPHPPFGTGSPARAGPEMLAASRALIEETNADYRDQTLRGLAQLRAARVDLALEPTRSWRRKPAARALRAGSSNHSRLAGPTAAAPCGPCEE